MTPTLIELRMKEAEAAQRMLPVWRATFEAIGAMQAEMVRLILKRVDEQEVP